MATFLFLVSVSATTLLLLAIAAEEIARVTRRFFAHGRAEPSSALPLKTATVPQLNVPPRVAAHPRPAVAAPKDWVPDRAA